MKSEQRLLQRLERREKLVEDLKQELLDDQRGFLLGLGWQHCGEDRWVDASGEMHAVPLPDAVELAKKSVREQ